MHIYDVLDLVERPNSPKVEKVYFSKCTGFTIYSNSAILEKIAFCRFAGESAIRQLPVWVRPQVKKYDVFGRALRDMIVFFKTAEQTVSLFPSVHLYF